MIIVLQNILKVCVKTIGKGGELHSYVSISDCVQHFLLFGGFGIINLKNNICENIDNIFDSIRCQEQCNKALSDFPNMDSPFLLPVFFFV